VAVLPGNDRVAPLSCGVASGLRLPKSRKGTHRWRRRFWSNRRIIGSSAEEPYKNADGHFRWAESAKTEHERAALLRMAAAWLEVAKRWEVATTASSAEPARRA
jgi:hypothetical protein